MPRPRTLKPSQRVTPYASRVVRQQALREAGGWIGTVELSPAGHDALRALQGDASISATIDAVLIASARRAPSR